MVKIQNPKIGESKVVISEKPLIQNSKIKAITIMSETSAKSLKNNEYDLEELDYDDVQRFFEENRKKLIGNHRVQINVLTEAGWRAGQAFNANEKDDWYNTKKQYKDALYDLDVVYAIQILVLD